MRAPGGRRTRIRRGRKLWGARALALGLALGLGAVGLALGALSPSAAAQPSSQGQWTNPLPWPVVGIHAVMLPTGKVLHYSYPEDGSGSEAWLWDPVTDTFTEVSLSGVDVFCSGHALLPDGRVLVTGGTDPASQDPVFLGIRDVYTFNPFTETWTRVGEMAVGRWYPTNVALPDGRMLIFSGLDENGDLTDLVEVYDPATGSLQVVPGAERFLDLYPRMHVLPSGKVFHAMPEQYSAFFDPTTNTWEDGPASNFGYRGEGTSVLLPLEPPDYRPRVLIAGGSPNPWGEPPDPATNTAEVLDLGAPNPAWQYTGSMTYARLHFNAVLLPDGRVLAVGGSALDNDESAAVYAAELYDPATGTWTEMASMQRPRMYHSTAVLLPDGRVLVAGTDGEFTAEIFSPPYLFQGPRPQIAAAPTAIFYGFEFTVETPDAADVARVVLVRPGAVTHTTDMEQRLIVLEFQAGAGELTVTAPPGANLAPPGYYMLFLLNSAGVPSVARFVRLQAGTPDTAAAFRVDLQGSVYADGAFYCGLPSGCFNAGVGADLAERIDTTEPVEPGDVVEIDPESPGKYRRARGPYSPRVAGVIASAPGIVLGNRSEELAALALGRPPFLPPRLLLLEDLAGVRRARAVEASPLRWGRGLASLVAGRLGGPMPQPRLSLRELLAHRWAGAWGVGKADGGGGRPLLALMGRVYVKAIAENGPIRPGDLLTTASKPGYAMRCPRPAACEGAIVGKALTALEGGEGLVEVLLAR